MGLLDNKDALMQGLLAFGGNTLANNTGHYGAFGPAVGRGIQGFGQSYFGAVQQQKENEERAKRLAMLEQMQKAQIGGIESENQKRQAEMDRERQLRARRAQILGGATPQQPGIPQGLGGIPSGGTPPFMPQMGGTVLPRAAAGAEGDLLASQIRQPAQNVPMETPPVQVTQKPLDFLQNPSALRATAMQLANAELYTDAKHYMELADKAEAQLNKESGREEETFTGPDGIVRWKAGGKAGLPLPNQQPKAPEGMQWGENGLQPVPGFLDMKKQIAAAGKPEVNVQVETKQQTEEAKTVGKFYGEQYGDIQKSGFNAQAKIDRFNRLDQLLDGVATGKLTPLGTDVAAYAKSVGINIDDKLPNKEAASALINAMALELRNPSGGAGMPGAMSDADREYLRTMVPSLANTPDGRKQLIETGRKMAQREKDVARLARDYRKKHGQLDEGFQDALEEFSAKNPLFQKASSNPEIDKLLKKYGN